MKIDFDENFTHLILFLTVFPKMGWEDLNLLCDEYAAIMYKHFLFRSRAFSFLAFSTFEFYHSCHPPASWALSFWSFYQWDHSGP